MEERGEPARDFGHLRWSSRADLVTTLLESLRDDHAGGGGWQRALAVLVELADAEELAEVRARLGARASEAVAARLSLACAMRGAPLGTTQKRLEIRGAARRMDAALSAPASERRWDNVAGRTCLYLLSSMDDDLLAQCLDDELGGRDSSYYASLYMSATVHLREEARLQCALRERWASAPWQPCANDNRLAIDRFRHDRTTSHQRLKAIYLDADIMPHEGLSTTEIARLFAADPQAGAAIVARVSQEAASVRPRPRSRKPLTGARAELRDAWLRLRDGDRSALSTIIEATEHEQRSIRTGAMRALLEANQGGPVFRRKVTTADDYVELRLALHALGRSREPEDHDLLLRTLLSHPEGMEHLACLALLAGVKPLVVDACVDDALDGTRA